jgi:hypothetical protein
MRYIRLVAIDQVCFPRLKYLVRVVFFNERLNSPMMLRLAVSHTLINFVFQVLGVVGPAICQGHATASHSAYVPKVLFEHGYCCT